MSTRKKRARFVPCLFQPLEPRVMLSSSPYGLMAVQARKAYGFDQLSYDGAGQTIAIVDAYDAPTIVNDLNVFDATMGIAGDASTFFTKYKMSASVKTDGGWAQEISLDVEWAHAIAPGAKILLVEARTSSMADLMAAVDYARHAAGVSVVSMSWGGTDSSSDTNWDSYFTTPAGHIGVTFVASSGDTGGVPIYPSTSPNVLSVGGTTLNVASDGTYQSETAWSGSGGGASKYENAPAYQTAVTGSTKRSTPDVAYDANPSTGFSVYDSTRFQGYVNWITFGGTSAGAPQWAALIALANQARGALGTLDGATQTLPALYAAPSSDFHDVTSGSTGHGISAGVGYDQATGLGSPLANLLVPYLSTTSLTISAVASGSANGTAQVLVPQLAKSKELQDVSAASPIAGTSVSVEQQSILAVTSPLPTVHEPVHAAAAIVTQQSAARVHKEEKKDEENWLKAIL